MKQALVRLLDHPSGSRCKPTNSENGGGVFVPNRTKTSESIRPGLHSSACCVPSCSNPCPSVFIRGTSFWFYLVLFGLVWCYLVLKINIGMPLKAAVLLMLAVQVVCSGEVSFRNDVMAVISKA